MVRSKTVTTAWRTAATCLALTVLTLAFPLAGEQQKSATGAPAAVPAAIETLLQKAPDYASGTYVVTGSALERAAVQNTAVVQADVLRGPNKTIRVPVALGADVTQPSTARLRLVTVPAPGGAARVVADATGSAKSGRLRLVHDFTLAPGEYEIQAVVGHSRGEGAYLATLTKTRLTVPDVWQGPLVVTPLVLGDGVATVTAGGTPAPFTFGRNVLQPVTTDSFAQESAINVAFRIYNWKADDGAPPDLTVDYLFYQQGTRRLTFFNKLKQEHLQADTLGAKFNAAAGMVAAGMTVPLVSFPVGEFQLTVRVTDTRTKQSGERQARFNVAR